jgi:hypothetical protein
MPRVRPIPNKMEESEPVRVKPGQTEKVPPQYAVEIDLEDDFPQEAQSQESGDEARGEEGHGEEPQEQTLSRQAEEVRQAEESRQRQAAEAERTRQEAAQRQAHAEELARERRAREQSEYDAIVNALAGANSDLAAARADYKAARTANDIEAETDAAERIADARYRIQTLSGGKEAKDAQQEQAAQQPTQYQQPRQAPTPTEIINSMTGLMPGERSWLMKHQELVTSQEGQTRLQAAYYDATKAGIARDTPEYFQFFDERLGFDDDGGSAPAMAEKQNRGNGGASGARVSAPVSRNSTDLKTGREAPSSTKVTLNQQQREAAKFSGVDEAEYARQVLKLIKLKKDGHYQES